MNSKTITQTEYKKLLEDQKELRSNVGELKKIILEVASEELKPSVIKRLERRSRDIDRGKGKRFNNLTSLKSYLARL